MPTVATALSELYVVEMEFQGLMIEALNLHNVGGLTDEQREKIDQTRTLVSGMENALYAAIMTLLDAARAFVPGVLVDQVVSAIPEPPDHPQAPGTQGLGFPPVVVWAAAVVAAISAVAAVWAVIKVADVAAAVVADIVRVGQNTKRYKEQLQEVRRRYERCLGRGGSTAECAELFPTPDAPLEEPALDRTKTKWWIVAAASIGVATVVGGGLWYYARAKQGFQGLSAVKQRRPRALRAGEIRSALGSYNLEVEA